jgi:hypothetical protein
VDLKTTRFSNDLWWFSKVHFFDAFMTLRYHMQRDSQMPNSPAPLKGSGVDDGGSTKIASGLFHPLCWRYNSGLPLTLIARPKADEKLN